MKCYVYKGSEKDDTYLYLLRPNEFCRIPKQLLDALGTLTLVLDLDLSPDRTLGRENAKVVLRNLIHQGYHLQLPENVVPLEPPRLM